MALVTVERNGEHLIVPLSSEQVQLAGITEGDEFEVVINGWEISLRRRPPTGEASSE